MIKFAPIWIGAYILAFLPVLLGLVAGVAHGVESGDWGVLGRTAGDAVFGADQQIYDSTNVLLNADSIPIEDENLRNVYIDALRSKIGHSFVLLFMMWFIVFKLVKFIWSNPGVDNFQHKLLWGVIALVIIMLVEMIYVGAVLGEGFVVPLRGVFLALKNMGSIFSYELPSVLGDYNATSGGNFSS